MENSLDKAHVVNSLIFFQDFKLALRTLALHNTRRQGLASEMSGTCTVSAETHIYLKRGTTINFFGFM